MICLGGCDHGKLVRCNRPYYNAPVLKTPVLKTPEYCDGFPVRRSEYDIHRYIDRTLIIEEKRFRFWVWDKLSEREAVEIAIKYLTGRHRDVR